MADAIPVAELRRLHPRAITDPEAIEALLLRVWREQVELRRGTNRLALVESARIREIGEDLLLLETRDFERRNGGQIFLNVVLAGQPYFFVAPTAGEFEGDLLRVSSPAAIYQAERRDRVRRGVRSGAGAPTRVRLLESDHAAWPADVEDVSVDGLGVRVRGGVPLVEGQTLQIEDLDGTRAGQRRWAELKNRRAARDGGGWQRIGLAVLPAPPGRPPDVERWDRIAPARVAAPRPGLDFGAADVRLVEYANQRGEKLRAIVDGWGDTRGAPVIVIPPAWGKTKETLLPLAETLVATFREAGEPVSVLRYDGIRRRGESHNDPECRLPGYENLHYTFGQGAEDVLTTLDFLEHSEEYRPSTVILVTFSVASIEARHAIARETRGRIGGWISVVGSSDPQSLMRVISGGVDYLGGADRGVRFGFQDVQGMLLDIDRAAADAIERGIAFLDDARRDLARIQVPITWLHGRYDAWMQVERIRHALSFGDSRNRRLLEVPTGHQLKSSREALEAFQLISVEAARMCLGREVAAGFPDPQILKQRRRLEMRRFARPDVDLRDFWRDYLVGRDGQLGIELVTGTTSYQDLMEAQIEALAPGAGERVVDLGSGAGALPARLTRGEWAQVACEIVEVDYVLEGLVRTRERLTTTEARDTARRVRFLTADLDVASRRAAIPLASGCADAALASLLLNYLSEPAAFLREVHRILRPGGRFVLSALRRDADTSQICVSGVAELRAGLARELFGEEGERRLDQSLHGFINDAARLLDLEERGVFHFWDEDELRAMLEAADLEVVSARMAYGTPPQAIVVSARRPVRS